MFPYASSQSSNSLENNKSAEMLFELSDYLNFSAIELQEQCLSPTSEHLQNHFLLQEDGDQVNEKNIGSCSKKVGRKLAKSASKKSSIKVAFKTKSELEILDDGYKWRKYGKKKELLSMLHRGMPSKEESRKTIRRRKLCDNNLRGHPQP
ncbi:probable WRKY transcription factor 51 isoform X2 [Asparagus officinalis]|uniref:probable WRKY transcription factor 51 isoform X2 n=1 Tax=Asparagus officinalis TaxID=4686 RepID=UPI00098DE5F6|nr:probable WRKY transcription factor 51 isoform X2 [Asparagus officinalis]